MRLMKWLVGMWFMSVSNFLACGVGIRMHGLLLYVRTRTLSLSASQTASKSSAEPKAEAAVAKR